MRSLAIAFVALLGVLSGCSDAVTQVVVSVEAESTFSTVPTNVRVIVSGAPAGSGAFEAPARDVTLRVAAGGTYTFPIDVTVAPRGGDASRRWQVEALASTETGGHVATVRVRGTYVSGRTLRVALLLENACDGVPCAAQLTCAAGACVPIPVVDPSATDAGVDASTDGGPNAIDIGRFCAGSTPFVPDPGAMSIGSSVPPYPPQLESCSNNHTSGQLCPSSTYPDDVCFSQRSHVDFSLCRIPCATSDADGGIVRDEARCQAYHPDSHCAFTQGRNSDADRHVCTIPCNPFDDTGCPAGLHCFAHEAGDAVVTDCAPLAPSPGFALQPCSPTSGSHWDVGCAPGHYCGYSLVCGDPGDQGYVCLQLCDPSITSPTVACPTGTACDPVGQSQRTIGEIEYGLCRPI